MITSPFQSRSSVTRATIGSDRAVTLSTVSTSWHFTSRPNGANSSPIGGVPPLSVPPRAAAGIASMTAGLGSGGMRKISGSVFFSSLRLLAGLPGGCEGGESSRGTAASAMSWTGLGRTTSRR